MSREVFTLRTPLTAIHSTNSSPGSIRPPSPIIFKMVSTKLIVCLAFFFTAALAAPKSLKVIEIVEDFLPVTLFRQEDAEFAVNSSQAGFGRLTEVGVRVTKGASARLLFDITIDAVSADKLDRSDSSFVSTLSESEKETYRASKTTYGGGLNVRMFGFLGINLGARTTRESMERSRDSQSNYDVKTEALREILEDVTSSKVRIQGELLATGISFIPTTASAFIKSARVTLNDGSTLTVVSTSPDDVVAADTNGNVLPDDDKTINVFDF